MLKKTFLLLSIPISFVYLKAQDISVATNTIDVYSSNPINGTAKYNSMAGSIGALGGDISSANVNPAGIGVFITNDLNLTLGVHSNKNTTTFAGQSLSNKINNTDVINTGGLLTFNLNELNSNWKFVNVGVNYSTRSLDNYVNTAGNSNIKIIDNDFADPNQVINYTYLGHGFDRYGDQSKMNFAVGANYDNRLYFGAGLNFQTSFLRQFDSAAFHSDYDNTNLIYNKQYTGYEESADGFSANIGMIAKVSNQFRVGAAIESPTWWSIDRVYNLYTYSEDKIGNEDRNLVTPMKVTLSAAFVPSKNFALNVDFIQGITKPKYDVVTETEDELNDLFSDSYKNASEVRVGAEYRINAFRVRGGYSYQGNSFDNLTLLAYNDNGNTSNQSFPNLLLGKKNTIGAGLGYDFKAFYIDASYQSITSEYSSPFLQGNVDYNSGYFNGGFDVNSDAYAVSKVKNKRDNFFVTVGWKF